MVIKNFYRPASTRDFFRHRISKENPQRQLEPSAKNCEGNIQQFKQAELQVPLVFSEKNKENKRKEDWITGRCQDNCGLMLVHQLRPG